MTLTKMIVLGRMEGYVKKSSDYNPYLKDELYDWKFIFQSGGYRFEDYYRGYNPYSGVEYVYVNVEEANLPIWQCDYVGQAIPTANLSPNEIYGFLKTGRREYLELVDKDLFFEFSYRKGRFEYKSFFDGDFESGLQTEEIYYKDRLAARQLSAHIRIDNSYPYHFSGDYNPL